MVTKKEGWIYRVVIIILIALAVYQYYTNQEFALQKYNTQIEANKLYRKGLDSVTHALLVKLANQKKETNELYSKYKVDSTLAKEVKLTLAKVTKQKVSEKLVKASPVLYNQSVYLIDSLQEENYKQAELLSKVNNKLEECQTNRELLYKLTIKQMQEVEWDTKAVYKRVQNPPALPEPVIKTKGKLVPVVTLIVGLVGGFLIAN